MKKLQYLINNYNLWEDVLIPFGVDKFKIDLSINQRIKNNPLAKLVVVTSINPTKAGEGKTTVSIGLGAALNLLNQKTILSLREPSLGPFFGMKGGASGAGKTYLEPELDINLHFTGDIHAINSANNLISALIDAHIFHGNELGIDQVFFKRTIDINDRALRDAKTAGCDGYTLTAASELMAIIALSKNFLEMKSRIANIVIGLNSQDKLIKLSDIGGVDSVCLLLKDTIKPNIVLSNELVPAIVHTGCFANIAHGCSSVIGTNLALKLADYVVTEAGFGADLGLEKFVNIKQPLLEKTIDLVVVVISVKAIKEHSLINSDNPIIQLESGIKNVQRHLENITSMGLNFVIALNYMNDSSDELMWLQNWAINNKYDLSIAKGYSEGGKGMLGLANLVMTKSASNKQVPIYQKDDSTTTKIEKIAKKIYHAQDVVYSNKALRKLTLFKQYNYPVCIAKTPHSFTDDPDIKGAPINHTLHISDINLNNGAQMIVVKTKGIMLLPGLSKRPRALDIKIDDEGNLI